MNMNFNVYLPLTNHDQDAEPIANNKFLIVCDGLGGDGSAVHFLGNRKDDTLKSAYLGSRKLASVCNNFYETNYNDFFSENNIPGLLSKLKQYIKDEFNQYLIDNPRDNLSKGGMIFPTTLASALFRETENGVEATVIWAGDSRAYLFTKESGIQQLSRDDVLGEFDACFGKDCKMSNCISQDQDFSLNYARYLLPAKCILFVCSDGCFDFVLSPMHFEVQILKGLRSKDFKIPLQEINPGDDCTMAGAVFGYTNNELDEAVLGRLRTIAPSIQAFNKIDKAYDERLSSSKVEMQQINSKLRKYLQKNYLDIKNAIIKAFESEFLADTSDNEMLHLSEYLKTYEPYKQYLENIKVKIEQNEQLKKECQSAYESFCEALDDAERKKRIIDRRNTDFSRIFNWITPSTFSADNEPKPKNDSTNKSEKAKSEIMFNIDLLKDELAGLKGNIDGNADNLDATVNKIQKLLCNLTDSIGSYKKVVEFENNDKKDLYQDVLSEQEFRSVVMPNVIKHGIQHYRGFVNESQYEELLKKYNCYLEIRDDYESDDVMSAFSSNNETIIKNFKQDFLREHFSYLAEKINDYERLTILIPSLEENIELKNRLKELQNGLVQFEIEKKSIWETYKVNYELYSKCTSVGSV
jgi:serine/threonine protein phosphatase PrpC